MQHAQTRLGVGLTARLDDGQDLRIEVSTEAQVEENVTAFRFACARESDKRDALSAPATSVSAISRQSPSMRLVKLSSIDPSMSRIDAEVERPSQDAPHSSPRDVYRSELLQRK